MKTKDILNELDIGGVTDAARDGIQHLQDKNFQAKARRGGMERYRKHVIDTTIKDIEDGIKGGRITLGPVPPPTPPGGGAPTPPGGGAPTPPGTGQPQPQPPPAGAGQPQPPPAGAGQPASGGGQRQRGQGEKAQIDQLVDKVLTGVRQLKPVGNKPIPPNSEKLKVIKDEMGRVRYNKDNLVRVGSRILELNQLGYDVTDIYKQFMGQLALGRKQKTIQEARLEFIYLKLLNEASILKQLRDSGYNPVHIFKTVTKRLNEAREYIRVSSLLLETCSYSEKELLMEAGGEPLSIAAYLQTVLPNILRIDGTKLKQKEFVDLIQQVQTDWKKDKGRAALLQIADKAIDLQTIAPDQQVNIDQGQTMYNTGRPRDTKLSGGLGGGGVGYGGQGGSGRQQARQGQSAPTMSLGNMDLDRQLPNMDQREAMGTISTILGKLNPRVQQQVRQALQQRS